ncbi:hypothetical protein TcG_08834 [Trypanosoma cruzi]|nr:hypothetical protein TcG_08834 [Trypanosoma cruzi]
MASTQTGTRRAKAAVEHGTNPSRSSLHSSAVYRTIILIVPSFWHTPVQMPRDINGFRSQWRVVRLRQQVCVALRNSARLPSGGCAMVEKMGVAMPSETGTECTSRKGVRRLVRIKTIGTHHMHGRPP